MESEGVPCGFFATKVHINFRYNVQLHLENHLIIVCFRLQWPWEIVQFIIVVISLQSAIIRPTNNRVSILT